MLSENEGLSKSQIALIEDLGSAFSPSCRLCELEAAGSIIKKDYKNDYKIENKDAEKTYHLLYNTEFNAKNLSDTDKTDLKYMTDSIDYVKKN